MRLNQSSSGVWPTSERNGTCGNACESGLVEHSASTNSMSEVRSICYCLTIREQHGVNGPRVLSWKREHSSRPVDHPCATFLSPIAFRLLSMPANSWWKESA